MKGCGEACLGLKLDSAEGLRHHHTVQPAPAYGTTTTATIVSMKTL